MQEAIVDPNELFTATIETVIANDTFMSRDPHMLLETGEFNRVPFFIGNVLFDGTAQTSSKRQARFDIEMNNSNAVDIFGI